MVREKKSALFGGSLVEALRGVTEVEVERPNPAPSALAALSRVVDDLTKDRVELMATIAELQSCLADSEKLIDQLRNQLAQKDGRSSGNEDHLDV